jgi:hypothetical protein
MGFFSKVFKGVGKVFRKIGRGLKKVVAKIGKFMGKIGIVGQIALGLLLPGVGSMLSGMLGSVGGALAGSSNILLRGAGQFIEKAISLGTQVGKAFSTVTEGVTKVVGETVGTFANELGLGDITKTLTGGKIDITNKNFGNLFERTSEAITNTVAEVKDIFSPLSSAGSIPTSADVAAEYDYTKKDQAPITEEQVADYTKEWDIKQNVSKVANENTILKSQPSLLDNIVEGIKEIPDKVIDAGKEFFTDLPGKGVEAATSGFQSGVESKVLNELGVETRPVQNITSVSGYVPTIDMSGTSDIGIGSAQFNPIDYMANNSESMSLKPFGFNANIYNYANQYKGAMSQYGYAV